MGKIGNFFKKIGSGIKKGIQKVGRFVTDKVIPTVSRIGKPILNVMGMLPGKLGMIGKVGSGIADVVTGIADQIPNQKVRDTIKEGVGKVNDGFQRGIDKGQQIATRVNDTAQQVATTATNMYNTARKGSGKIKTLM